MRSIFPVMVAALVLSNMVCASAANSEHIALGKASTHPIEVTSKKLTAKAAPGSVELTFEGRVKVKQDEMTLSCDKLVVLYEEKNKSDPEKKNSKDIANSIKHAIAIGNVKVVKNELTATSGKALFDNLKRTVTLTEGPPKVWQGPHVLSAPTIVIYLDESRAELLGADENGVRGTLNPARPKKEKEK
jgi:lipopolysaccharide transport protein LptA